MNESFAVANETVELLSSELLIFGDRLGGRAALNHVVVRYIEVLNSLVLHYVVQEVREVVGGEGIPRDVQLFKVFRSGGEVSDLPEELLADWRLRYFEALQVALLRDSADQVLSDLRGHLAAADTQLLQVVREILDQDGSHPLHRAFRELVEPVYDRFEVFEFRECLQESGHLAVVDPAVVESDSVDDRLEELGRSIEAVDVPWAQRVVGQAQGAIGHVRQDRQRNVLVHVALDEVLVFRVVPVFLVGTVLVRRLVHVAIQHLLVELGRIVPEHILFDPRQLQERVRGAGLLVEAVVHATLEERVCLALTQEVDMLRELRLELFLQLVPRPVD